MGVSEGNSLITALSPIKEVKLSLQNMFLYIYVSAAFPNNVSVTVSFVG